MEMPFSICPRGVTASSGGQYELVSMIALGHLRCFYSSTFISPPKGKDQMSSISRRKQVDNRWLNYSRNQRLSLRVTFCGHAFFRSSGFPPAQQLVNLHSYLFQTRLQRLCILKLSLCICFLNKAFQQGLLLEKRL